MLNFRSMSFILKRENKIAHLSLKEENCVRKSISSSSCSETVNVDTRSSHIVGCQWLGNRQDQKYPRGLKPQANHGNLRV